MRSVIDRLRPRSLRGRLIAWYSVLVVVLFTLLSVATYSIQSRALAEGARASVDRERAIVRTALQSQISMMPPFWPTAVQIPEIDAYTAPGITIAILDRANTIRYQSVDGGNVPRIPVGPASQQVLASGKDLVLETYVEGQRTLVVLAPVEAGVGQVIGVSLVARSLADVDAALANLRWLLIGATLAALLLALGGGFLLTHRALEPLTRIAHTANAITQGLGAEGRQVPQTLQTRVPTMQETGELGTLVLDFNRMLDALAAYDDRQRQFIADASHELRTPLTTIRGNLEFVRRTPTADPIEREQALEDASAEAGRMAMLVNDLLVLARSEAQSLANQHWQAIEADALLVEVFQIARERARAQGLPVDAITLTTLTPVMVQGDPMQLRQVLLILIDNALKYAPGSLALGLRREQQQAIFTVRDAGPGVSNADVPHIFDRFYRADQARDREGSGLGLAIARTLVRNHHGELAVSSQLQHGTTFTVRLPVGPTP